MTEQQPVPAQCPDGEPHRWVPKVPQKVGRKEPLRWVCRRCQAEQEG